MSWFKRRPRIKEQPKQAPHHTSPFTEKMMEESKKRAPKKKEKKSPE